MKKFILCATLIGVASFVNANEISVFGAGGKGGYGLSSKESAIYQNQEKVDALEQKIEGLQTLIEGLNRQISDLNSRIEDLETRAKINPRNTSNNSKKKLKNESLTKSDSKNSLVNYKNMKNSEILKLANTELRSKEYKEGNKDLTSAISAYKYLLSKNYEPALINYKLGEAYYVEGKYANAIKQYKKSVSIKNSGDYMPKLLYHTAISFDKIKDKNAADKFYGALKSSYPNSKYAKSVKNRP